MEQEVFLSGYCRVLDQSRMVEVLLDADTLLEADCCYGNCIYESNCPIAEQIRQLIKK